MRNIDKDPLSVQIEACLPPLEMRFPGILPSRNCDSATLSSDARFQMEISFIQLLKMRYFSEENTVFTPLTSHACSSSMEVKEKKPEMPRVVLRWRSVRSNGTIWT